MPRTISSMSEGDEGIGQNREIDALWAEVDALKKATGAPKTIRIGQRVDASDGQITVQDSSGTPTFLVSGIEFNLADGVSLSLDGDLALITVSGAGMVPATTVTPVGAANVVGIDTTYAREDHAHKGIHSIIAGSQIAVSGVTDVTIDVALAGYTYSYRSLGAAGMTLVPLVDGDLTMVFNHTAAPVNVACNGADQFSDGTTVKAVAAQTAAGWLSVSDPIKGFNVHFPVGGL